MRLDLSIRHQENIEVNEKGLHTWTVVEIGNYRNVWHFISNLRLENCLTQCFSGEEIKKELKYLPENEYIEMSELEELLKDEEPYELHAWW